MENKDESLLGNTGSGGLWLPPSTSETDTRAEERRDWPDLEFTAVLHGESEYANVRAAFSLYTHEGYADDGTGNYTVPLFWREGAASNADGATNTAEAEASATLNIKWDGCAHVDIPNAHVCGREDLDHLTAALARVWDWAKSIGMDRLDD